MSCRAAAKIRPLTDAWFEVGSLLWPAEQIKASALRELATRVGDGSAFVLRRRQSC